MEGLSTRDLLRVGLQVLGVVAILIGLSKLLAIIGIITVGQEMPLGIQIATVLEPAIILAAGLFLTIGSKGIVIKLYPDSEEKADSGEALFILAMKILGAVLIVMALPIAVKVISNLIYIKSVSPIWNTDFHKEYIYSNLLPSILYFIFGWYLLKGGKLLVRMAFRDKVKEDG